MNFRDWAQIIRPLLQDNDRVANQQQSLRERNDSKGTEKALAVNWACLECATGATENLPPTDVPNFHALALCETRPRTDAIYDRRAAEDAHILMH